MKKNSFVEGTIIYTFAIVFTKVLGILYVIPFYAIIGTEGSSLYSYAYNIYVIFLSISSAGIPSAISKLVSEFDTKNLKEAKVRTLNLGIKLVLILSIICFLVLFVFAKYIVLIIIGDKIGGNSLQDIVLVVRAVSFSVLIVPFLSITRGYLQGHKFITPSSISQMLEQVVRIIVVLLGSFVVIKVLKHKIALGVAAALIGSFIGGFIAILYLLKKIDNNKSKLSLDKKLKEDSVSNKEIMQKIATYAVPFIVIHLTVYFFNICDMTFIIRTLGKLGYTGAEAEFVSAAMTTWGYKLNMIVNAIATGLTVSLIPHVVSAYTKGDGKKVNVIFNRALQIALLVSMPAAFGLSFLAAPVWNLFYGVSKLGPVVFKLSILTSIMCNVYLIALQTAQSISEYKTVYKGVIIGFSMNFIFDVPFMYICYYIGIPAFYGATFATMLGYIVAIGIILKKLLEIKDVHIRDSIKVFSKLALNIIIMIIVLSLLKIIYPYHYMGRILTIVYIAVYALVGALIYLGLCYKMGLIDKILGKDMLQKLISKLTFGIVKVKGEVDENKNN